MKQFFFLLAGVMTLASSVTTANAQSIAQDTTRVVFPAQVINPLPVERATTGHPSTGDLYDGLTRKITFDRMIPPYGLEVSYHKTVHIIFPAAIRYIDLGSTDIIAGKADGSENVIRVKAAVEGFERETNFSVITDEGSFYSFNVKYADQPDKLNVEMADFLHDGEAVNRPNNSLEVYLKELGNASPKVIHLIMRSIYESNRREISHIGSKRFGIRYLLKGIYAYGDFLYFHTSLVNSSNVPFDIDYVRIKVVDKKTPKRTAIQEQVLYPVRAYRPTTQIAGKTTSRTVFCLRRFTIPDGKQLIVELFEKNGGRHQSFVVENADIVRAKVIDDLKVK